MSFDFPNAYNETNFNDTKNVLDERKQKLNNIQLDSITLQDYITFNNGTGNKIESIKFEAFYQAVISNKTEIKKEIDNAKTVIKTQIAALKRKTGNGVEVVSAHIIQNKLKELIINTTIIKVLTLLYAYLVFRQQFQGNGSPTPPPPPSPTPSPAKIDLNILLGLTNVTEIYNPYLLNNTTDNASRSIFNTEINVDTITKIEKGESVSVNDTWTTHLANNQNHFYLLTALVARAITTAAGAAGAAGASNKYIKDGKNEDAIVAALKKIDYDGSIADVPTDNTNIVWNYSKTIVTDAIRINQREEARALNVYYYALDTIPLYMNIGLTEAS